MPSSSFSEAVSKRKRSSGSGSDPAAALLGGSDPLKPQRDPYVEMVQTIARLRVAGGTSADLADQMVRKYGNEIPPELLAQYGIQAPKKDSGGFLSKAKRVGTGALVGGLDLLGRPGQASLELLQAGGQALDKTTGIDFFGDAEQGGGSLKDVGKALLGKQDHRLNLREAVGLDPNSGGRLAGFFDTVGSIALDPTTYVTAGTAPLAQQGIKQVGKELGEEAAQQVAKQGFKSLAPEARAGFRQALVDSAEASASKFTGEEFAQRTITALERGGRGGVKLGGRTIVGGETIRAARSGLGVSDTTAAGFRRVVGTPNRLIAKGLEKVIEPVRNAIIPRAEIEKALGREVSAQVHDAATVAAASFAQKSDDVIQRLSTVAKKSGVEPDELESRFLKALDKGGDVKAEVAALRTEGRGEAADLLEEMQRVRQDIYDEVSQLPGVLTGEDLDALRQQAFWKGLDKAGEKIIKPLAPATKLAERTRAAADKAAELAQSTKGDIGASLEGAGRNLTAAEGKRVGVLAERFRAAEANAAKLEGKLAKITDSTTIRQEAFDRAVDDAIKGLPKAQKGVHAVEERAMRASDELENYVSELLQVEKPTAAQLRKLGKLEGRAQLFEKEAARANKGLDRAVTKAGGKVGEAGARADSIVARQEARAARQASVARTRADEALAHAQEVRDELVRKASLADAKAPTAAQAKRLGVVEERARSAENLAKLAEKRLGRVADRVGKDLREKAVEQAEKAADKAVRKAVKKNVYLRDVDSYVMRELTDEGRKALEAVGGDLAAATNFKGNALTGALGQGGKLKSRVLLPDESILDANAQLAEKLGKDGLKVYETNPVQLSAKRAIGAYRASSEVQYISNLSKITDQEGNALVMIGKADKEAAKKLGYQSVSSQYFGDVYAHPLIAKEIEKVNAVVFNDASIKGWENVVDKWGSLWAGYATTPVLFGTGFFARNSMGNVFNNFLAGIKDPNLYVRAAKAQRAVKAAIKETGRSAGPEFEAALLKALPEREGELVLLARKHGVFSTGFFSSDLGDDIVHRLDTVGKARTGRFNPLNKDNMLLKPGQDLNGLVENNARVAHFLGKMDELGDPVQASRSVKKYLFDYSDLTPFEKNKMRRFVRFYTYMRKNTPLMFSEMAHQPGKFTAFAHINEGIAGQGEDSNGVLPQYAINNGAVQFKGKLFSVDTPFSAAMQTVQPAVQAIALIPGVKELVPEQLHPEGGFSEVASGAINMPSGGPIEVLKFLTEETVGKSLFTGAPLQAGADARAKRFAAAINPLFAKGLGQSIDREKGASGLLKGGVIDQALNLSGRDKERVKLLTSLIGVSTVYNDPQAQRGEKLRQLSLVQKAMDELRSKGVDVPTIAELREVGIIPEADAKPKSSSGKKRW